MPSNEEEIELLRNQVRKLELELDSIKNTMSNHSGIGAGFQDIYSPHPDLIVNSLFVGGEYIRADEASMQFLSGGRAAHGSDSHIHIFYVVDEFQDTPSDLDTYKPAGFMVAMQDSSHTKMQWQVTHLNDEGFSSITIDDQPGTKAETVLGLNYDGNSVPDAFGTMTLRADENDFYAGFTDNMFLWLGGRTSDPDSQFIKDGMIWYRDDLDEFRVRINGSTTTLATGSGGGMNLVVQESDQTVNSQTTLQNTELAFAVAANEVWQFEGAIICRIASVPDIKFQATGPTGAVGSWAILATDAALADGDGAALGSPVDVGGFNNDFSLVRFWGAIHNGANSGNLTIQFAQNTSDATSTTVYAGSYIKYQIES